MSNEIVTKIKGALEAPASQQKLLDFFGDDKSKATKFKSALMNIAQNPILSGCTAQSILKSAFSLAETGLEITPILGQAYILKYKQDAEAVISYKGWQALIERAGKRVKAFSVFKCDEFSIDLSDFDEKITFKPNYAERNESDDNWYKDNLLGVLIKIKDMSDGYIKNTFVTSAKIEKIKGKSPSAKSAYSPYNSWAEEMYLAKAIKYALSREALNLKDESIRKAINLDNELDIKLQNDNKAEVKDLAEDLIDIEASEAGEENENS